MRLFFYVRDRFVYACMRLKNDEKSAIIVA